MLYAFFWVILHTYPPMKMEQTECSETLAYKIQTPGNYPEESIQHSEHGQSLKSRIVHVVCFLLGNSSYLPTLKMEQTECSETLAYKIQTPGNYPEESVQHSEHGESLKSRIVHVVCFLLGNSSYLPADEDGTDRGF
jgi:hypothetical protein